MKDDDLLLSDPLESKVERDSIEYAEKHGWWVAKFVSPGLKGVPDRIFIRDGSVFFVEFKREGKEPRRLQAKRIREMQAHGAKVFVIDNLKDAQILFR